VIELYHFPASPCSQKVRLALAEKGVEHRARFVDIELRMQNYEPWYVRLNPRCVVPTLVHGDLVVTDSARIIRYIDETFEGPPLSPEDPNERARMGAWIEAQDQLDLRAISYASIGGLVGAGLRRVTMPLRVRRLRRLRDEVPELRQQYSDKLEDVRGWQISIASDQRLKEIRAAIEATLDRAEAQLGETGFLASVRYSLADLAWTAVLARLRFFGLAEELWGGSRRPRVAEYYARLRARPSFEQADIWEEKPHRRVVRALRARLSLGHDPTII
jgi:glutathione S-transferase